MTTTLTRSAVRLLLDATLGDAREIRETLAGRDALALPADAEAWLGGLALLRGVPFRYLVPDERMLPTESIRHFRLDTSWVTALIDGAFSIGRNPTTDADTPTMLLDTALTPAVHAQTLRRAATLRTETPAATEADDTTPNAAPSTQTEPEAATISGFLLRSRVVRAQPAIGVHAYATAAGNCDRLPLLRLERLGPDSDTLLCLVRGAAARFDVYEPPEHLRFGIDRYDGAATPPVAEKEVRAVTVDPVTGAVAIGASSSLDLSACFRASAPRTIRAARLAAKLNAPNAADMGFCMTEGVGMVGFLSRGAR